MFKNHKKDCQCIACKSMRGETCGSSSPNWKGGFPVCEICGKVLSKRTVKNHRCQQHRSKEHLEKLSLSHISQHSSSKTEFKKGIRHSPKTEFKKGQIPWNKNLRGYRAESLNNFWKGGITPAVKKLRNCFKYKEWRKIVYERDNYMCQECGQKGGKLHVDHYIVSFSIILNTLNKWVDIDNLYESALKFEPLWDINNGRTLCIDCHKKTDTYLMHYKKNITK